jgi:long-chain acyl-CoA synthetase
MVPPGTDPAASRLGQGVAVPDDDRHLGFAALLDNDGAFVAHPIVDAADTVAVLQYTGGTTGLPKGAMLTHGNLTAAVAQGWETMGGTPPVLVEGEERVLAVLPPFHIYALTANVLFGMRGAAEVILHARFDTEAVLHELAASRVTSFCGVPTMFSAVVNHPGVERLDLRALKYCGSGGAPLPVEVGRRFQELTGCPLCEGWGMTETSPTGTFTPLHGKRKPGSCGLPSPRIVIRFLDLADPGRYLPLGERGEICIGGPNVMKGYWNNPEATEAVMTHDGLMRTGDVGLMDEEGYVSIVDRCKDMLLCSGYNVYPRVLEEAIHEHPAVAEVCVIGIPDAYRGQSPKAFLTLKPGAAPFTLEQLQAFLGPRLGKHEMVQALDIRAELPKTAVGKLSKKDLVDEEAKMRLPHPAR